MSYIPIAPKSCITCVSRKVKCGMEEPTCLRCSKADLECAGYRRRPFIIVSPTQAKTGKKYRTRTKPARKRPSTNKATLVEHKQPTLSINSEYKSYALIRSQLISHFIDIYTPRRLDISLHDQQHLSRLPQYWVHILPTLKFTLPALQASSMALVCTYLGAITRNQSYYRQGVQLYSQALNLIAKSLTNSKDVDHTELLIAVYVMTSTDTFEIPHGPNPGWIAHTQAAYRLLERRVENLNDCNEDVRTMYNMIRKQYIYYGIVSRRLSPFRRPCWDVIAPLMCQNSYEELVHIMLEHGGMLEKLDKMEAESNQQAKLAMLQALEIGISIQAERYRQWYRDFIKEHGRLLRILPNEAFPDSENLLKDANFTQYFMFDDFLTCQSLTHLWCGHLFLVDVASHCYFAASKLCPALNRLFGFAKYLQQEEDLFDIISGTEFSGLWDKADQLAEMVCMAIPYYANEDLGAVAANSTIPISWVARKHYGTRVSLGNIEYQGRRNWCERALDEIARRRMGGENRNMPEEREFDGRSGYRDFLKP